MHKKGISLNSVEKFLSHSADKIRRTLLCFERILVSKIFEAKEGGSFTVLSKIFLSHRTEKTSPFSFSEKFWYGKKTLWISRFPVEIFVSNSAKKFRGHPFNFSENLGYRKIFMHNGDYHVFPSKIFGLTVPKNFVKEPFSVSLILGIKKCWG